MPDPLSIIGGVSALAGLGQTLFGSGFTSAPLDPEVQQIFGMLSQTAKEGLSDEEVDELISSAKRSIESEFGALTADRSRRLQLQGAGLGVQQAARNRLDQARLQAIGGATTQANLADIQTRQQALSLLAGFGGNLQRQRFPSGQGGANLLSSALNFLVFNEGRNNNQGEFFDFNEVRDFRVDENPNAFNFVGDPSRGFPT